MACALKKEGRTRVSDHLKRRARPLLARPLRYLCKHCWGCVHLLFGVCRGAVQNRRESCRRLHGRCPSQYSNCREVVWLAISCGERHQRHQRRDGSSSGGAERPTAKPRTWRRSRRLLRAARVLRRRPRPRATAGACGCRPLLRPWRLRACNSAAAGPHCRAGRLRCAARLQCRGLGEQRLGRRCVVRWCEVRRGCDQSQQAVLVDDLRAASK